MPKPRLLLLLLAVIIAIIAFLLVTRKKTVIAEKQIVCTRLPRVKITGRKPAFAPNYYLQWSNHVIIGVYFQAGVNKLTRSIVDTANLWAKYCGIRFKIVGDRLDAQVKVDFRSGGYASAIGIECKEPIYDTRYSMFLEGIDTLRDKAVFKRVVLHEFGHVLGLEHELGKPSAIIPWIKDSVYKFYKDKYKWSKTDVNKQIFAQYVSQNKEYDDFDSTSIMVYAVGPPMTPKNYVIPWPKGLAKKDMEGIATWYPKK